MDDPRRRVKVLEQQLSLCQEVAHEALQHASRLAEQSLLNEGMALSSVTSMEEEIMRRRMQSTAVNTGDDSVFLEGSLSGIYGPVVTEGGSSTALDDGETPVVEKGDSGEGSKELKGETGSACATSVVLGVGESPVADGLQCRPKGHRVRESTGFSGFESNTPASFHRLIGMIEGLQRLCESGLTKNQVSTSSPMVSMVDQQIGESNDIVPELPEIPRRSTRLRRKPDRLGF